MCVDYTLTSLMQLSPIQNTNANTNINKTYRYKYKHNDACWLHANNLNEPLPIQTILSKPKTETYNTNVPPQFAPHINVVTIDKTILIIS